MSTVAVARSSLDTNLRRYGRSWGLWLLLIIAVVAARFMVARDDGSGIQVAIGRHLPVMTSATLGVSLGIVLSTLLLPVGFLYLRSNTTRRQAWQVEEVTPGSRVAVMLGRFGADVAALFGMLLALTFAGWVLGAIIVTGPLNIGQLTLALWVVAAPALMGLAALRLLFDAVPLLRRGLGDLAFFILWITAIIVPATVARQPAGFAVDMFDFMGFTRPLVAGSPLGTNDFSIGNSAILPGRVPLDVMAGIGSDGYIASRLAWALVAVAVVAFAGLVYRPHTARRQSRIAAAIGRAFASGPPPRVVADAAAARRSSVPLASLVAAEFKLIGSGRLFRLLALVVAAFGATGDYRHMGSPAALLLLIFGMTAHAGRSEARGLLTLSRVAPIDPMLRRAAFIVAGTDWALLLAVPAVLVHGPSALLLATEMGAAAAVTAIVLAAFSGSAFAPRLVLIVAWYFYLST
ncbi:hypothetical protein KX816_13070 [Sphingosinicellaceae bacterium]|nr:hypothetical protein KX816_13070 [Sphingosinicellaceae bacterium]